MTASQAKVVENSLLSTIRTTDNSFGRFSSMASILPIVNFLLAYLCFIPLLVTAQESTCTVFSLSMAGPNAPQTVEGSLAIYTLFELALYFSATNCLSDYRTGDYTGAIDGTAFPATTDSGTFAYDNDLMTQLWTYTTPLTLTGPTHTAVLNWQITVVNLYTVFTGVFSTEFLIASAEPVQTSTATTNVGGTLMTTTFSTVNLSPSFTTPSTVSTITPITTISSTPATTGSSVSAGPIAGGVVGGIIVLGAIILFVWYKFFRGDHHHGHANNDNEDNDPTEAPPQRFKSINSGEHETEIPMENMDEMPSARTREEGLTG